METTIDLSLQLSLGSYDYRFPGGSGGVMRIHSYTQDNEYAFVSYPGSYHPNEWVKVTDWKMNQLTFTSLED